MIQFVAEGVKKKGKIDKTRDKKITPEINVETAKDNEIVGFKKACF